MTNANETEKEMEIEPEDKDDDRTIKPWDPAKIRITTKNFTIREVYNQIIEEELDLAPDFQRSFVWNPKQQVRLIESLLLGIPLPAFYFNQDSLGAFQVVDGVQRLTTVKLFMSNRLPLQDPHLEYLKELVGLTYATLGPSVKRRFAGTQIVAHVIEPQTPDEVKYDIFNRVNTGGSPLTAQEIRHCMSKARSREWLRTLVESEQFGKATGYAFWSKDSEGQPIRDNRRMADREMALRFCAFRVTSLDDYKRANSLDGFLLEFTRRIDRGEMTDEQLTTLIRRFERSMTNCSGILGDTAFRRFPPNALRRGPINRAIFESQALALAKFRLTELMPHKAEIVAAFRELFADPAYDAAVRSGTGDPGKVELRLTKPVECLAEILK